MSIFNKREPIVLLVGDLFFFLLSLWLALLLRTLSVPSKSLFLTHLKPFSFLFLMWVVVFYIAGLYEKHTVLLRSKLPAVIANTQMANSVLAVLFFYFIPFFGITPKTILFIYLFVSFALILFWRMYGYFLIGKKRPENAILIGSGEEMKELYKEVNSNTLYNLHFITSVDLARADEEGFWDEIISRIYAEDVSIVAIDLLNEHVEPVLPHLYNLIFSKITFVDMHTIYEDVFSRVPLSLLKHNWFLENISSTPQVAYDALKRLMDIVLAGILLVLSLPFDIFAFIAITFEDRGPAFITQDRVGKNNQPIKILKFRTMTGSDNGEYGEKGTTELRVTKVGSFLRKSRIDEFPQFWNVLTGDLSLVGPRPELPKLMKLYEESIPYYNIRHIIKPGLSGWAQIYQENHPHHGAAVDQTKEKLAYDLYYIKNRSLLLDLKIALRTVKTLFSRVGK
ncbi:MAG: sugar transferase [Parcubacteria group bacterium]|nr:sugar transferase [Parcubacteria group bacterium]